MKLYSSADCSGSPLASGTPAEFSSPGLTIAVANNQTIDLRATATDAAGNTSGCSTALAYTEDSSAPQTHVDSGAEGLTNEATPTFDFSATGGATGFECRFDSASFGACSGPGNSHTAAPALGEGPHTFEVRARDQAANIDPTPASSSFTVDTAGPGAPQLTDTDPNSPANDNHPEVKGSAEAGSTVRVFSTADCSGTPLASGSASELSSDGLTVDVADDETTSLRATARDAAGNGSACSAPIDYLEDSTPPDTTLTDFPPPKTTKRRVKVTFTATEPDPRFRCRLDEKSVKPCNSPWQKRVSLGKHVFRVYALDPGGNADATPAKAKFKVVD